MKMFPFVVVIIPTVMMLGYVLWLSCRELTNPVQLIVQPRAFIRAMSIRRNANTATGTILIHFTIVFFSFSIYTFFFQCLLAFLELSLLPEHVEVGQEPQVDVVCHLLWVFLQGFKFLNYLVNTDSLLLANQHIKRWDCILEEILTLYVCLQGLQCLCDLF